MTNPTYTDDQIETAIMGATFPNRLGEMLAYVYADRQRLQAEVDALRKDRERYFKLRDNPEDRDVLNTGMPWVVRVERINGIPTMNAIYGPELDFELDATHTTPNETKEAKS